LLKKFLTIGIIILFIFSSFSTLVIGFDAEKETSFQSVDGPMDSAWPMFGHDTKHTGKSSYGVEGNIPIEKWRFSLGEGMTFSSVAIDKDRTIYVGTSIQRRLYAINQDGTEKWRFETSGWMDSSPSISEDGTIYIGDDSGKLYAINPDGTEKWTIHLGRWVFSSPTIAEDGTIYVGSTNNNFYAINPDGTEKWKYETDYKIYSSAAIDDEGIIYIGSHDSNLYAFYSNGTLKWKYKTGAEIKSEPAIDEDGIIYFGSWDHYLYALYQNGTLNWRFKTDDATETSPTIANDGTIYVGTYKGNVFSISREGKENWRYKIGTNSDDWVLSSPSIDKYGIIYVGSLNGYIYALKPDGSLNWKYKLQSSIHPSPAIGEDGTIFIASHDSNAQPITKGYLYALDVEYNPPPNKPSISGPNSGKTGNTYNYTIITTDPEDDDVSYYVDWGDDNTGGWTRYLKSGEEYNVSHIWEEQGNYEIRVKAKDSYETESEWATL